ncbi:hypothetical protein LPB140_05625 [Sphingorhabdus lutea]|uniref:DUF2849 domain-containing protein n=1 Tax=Sphingorhabdus lutea TaxID=1913578 RepID=A0A1L3JB58_9SPHN|nr:DUF2849 domain-containing protein [Sphingorhabdus lutea]APG62361.1 hypothetical protein LPB140_05625 [Sphingorhabdus lutea]
MKLLTGNSLKGGEVLWWTGNGWSKYIADAVDAGDEGAAILEREEALQNINGSYIIDAEQGSVPPRPEHIKERIRALGPTVRRDLTLAPNDEEIFNQVIKNV